jgi:hypothetical protein
MRPQRWVRDKIIFHSCVVLSNMEGTNNVIAIKMADITGFMLPYSTLSI